MPASEEETDEPEPRTVDLVYREVEVQLDRQCEEISALDGRAQQLLGFAAGIFALIAGLQPPTGNLVVSILFAVGALVFVTVVATGYLALSIRGYYRDPEPEQLWPRYRSWPEDWLKQQIILNRLESWHENRSTIDAKLLYLRGAQVLLGCEIGYLVVVLILRPYVE